MTTETFKFVRTMRYTEVVEVQADAIDEARELAQAADGERIHDDTVVSLELCRQKATGMADGQ